MSDKNVADVLRVAKARLMEPGRWGKGGGDSVSYPRAGCDCPILAIKRTTGDFNLSVAAEDSYFTAAGFSPAKTRAGSDAFYQWHDAPERTLDEVLAVFDKAIAAATPTHGEER